MDTKQQTFYEHIKDGIIDEVDKVEMSTSSLLSMVARLRQATAFPGILTTEDIKSAKITRACELVKEIVDNGNKVVVFSTFKDTVYELQRLLKEYNPLVATGDTKDAETSNYIDKFQKDQAFKVFLAT
jgi:SNF2 family DNA or RNA helicase